MSKKCPICKSINCIVEVGKAGAGKPWFTCLHCHTDLWEEEILPVTVFDHITQSVETLAEKLVYCEEPEHFCENASWYSVLLGKVSYVNKAEAFAATVKELKKEWKSGKDIDVPANGTDNNVGSMEVING